jgi:hypothetical protein
MDIYNQLAQTISSLSLVILIIGALVNILFAAGIAKDISKFTQSKVTTQIVPGSVWVLATVIGGFWVALAYWIVHHSALSR